MKRLMLCSMFLMFAGAALAPQLAVDAAAASATMAQSERDELKDRFQQRHAALQRLLQDGKAGETWLGYVEAIDESLVRPEDERLIRQENDDRRRLYQLIAEDVAPGKEHIPAAVVAERNAKRNFRQAKDEEYLKIEEGRWIQKRDEARQTRLQRLKNEGEVGETWRGYVEEVNDRAGQQAKSLIEQENRDRKRFYQRIAESRGKDVSVDEVARDAGKQMLDHVLPGQHYLPRDGKWTRKPGRAERSRD